MAAHGAALAAALRAVIARDWPDEGLSLVQIEVDPWELGIHFCPTDEVLLAERWFVFHGELPGDYDAVLAGHVFPWLAAAWTAAGGPPRASPAYALWHGFDARYDLEQGVWQPSARCSPPRPRAPPRW